MSATFGFRFDNRYAQLPEPLFSLCPPQPVSQPEMVLFNAALAEQMGLETDALRTRPDLFSGNTLIAGSEPLAQAYAGHQFGNLTMLGDGRAILLGEHLDASGNRMDVQLKGAGRTPFSRGGDGRAALGPMLREYLISESMHALGVPTSRSLAVVGSGDPVYREEALPGAILTRIAASHLRVGTFQYAAAQQDAALMDTLIQYTLARHYPDQQNSDNPALALLDAVIERQASLIVQWMRVGFIHGVMNTDNVTLSGETIDYGPCAFMDAYDPDTVFSSIDHQGRYAYGNQPTITQWNLGRFAETLLTRINDNVDTAIEIATDRIKGYSTLYDQKWLAMMRRKLGLFGEDVMDATLIQDLLDWMQANRADFTNTFHALIGGEVPDSDLCQQPAFLDWHTRWQARLARNSKPRESSWCLMRNSNPAVIPRNHLVEQALTAATEQHDLAPAKALLAVLDRPYSDDAPEQYRRPPEPQERVCQTFCGT